MTLKDGLKGLEEYVFQSMSDSSMVGLSILTLQDDEVTYQRGIGFKDFDEGTSATTRTTYCIGSVTKSFTSLAVMKLQEDGLLSLDDPIERYLPFKTRPMGEQILIKHLLSHSSGLSALGYAEATLSAVANTNDQWFPIASPSDLILFMNGAENWAIDKPGRRYGYLNEGYILLGKIIEKVSGLPYEDYVAERILRPLGMTRSTFKEAEVELDDDVAVPYVTVEGVKKKTRYPYGQMIADGGLMSNAVDMSRFVRMLLSGGMLDGYRVASRETVKEMMAPKVETSEEPFPGASRHYYGYGLRIKDQFFGHDVVYHSGSVFGSSGYMGMVPDTGVAVVILANGGYWLEPMGEYALALMLDEDPSEIFYTKRTRTLDSLTGNYRMFRDTSMYEVTRSGGVLNLTTSFFRRNYTIPLIPVDIDGEPKRFKVYGVESVTPVEFILRHGERYMVYERNLAKKE